MQCHLERLSINYETAGSGRPLLILPGWTMSAASALDWLEPFFDGRDDVRRIYLDLPGHGLTPGTPWVQGLDDMLQIILDFVDAVLPGERFALAGLSLGAYLARGVLFRRTAVIDGLLMIVPVIKPRDDERALPPPVVLVEDTAAVAQLPPEMVDLLQIVVVRSQSVIDALLAFPDAPAGDPAFLEAIRRDPDRYALTFDVDALPEPFPRPALIVCGRQDSVTGYRDAWELLDRYPRATFAVLDRAGHLTEETEPLLHLLTQNWLDRVAESVP